MRLRINTNDVSFLATRVAEQRTDRDRRSAYRP